MTKPTETQWVKGRPKANGFWWLLKPEVKKRALVIASVIGTGPEVECIFASGGQPVDDEGYTHYWPVPVTPPEFSFLKDND